MVFKSEMLYVNFGSHPVFILNDVQLKIIVCENGQAVDNWMLKNIVSILGFTS